MRRRAIVWVGIPLGLAFGGGCATKVDPGDEVGSSTQALTGGSDDTGTTEANTVVLLREANPKNPKSPTPCTGILITPTVVLTARICVDDGVSFRPDWDVSVGGSGSAPSRMHFVRGAANVATSPQDTSDHPVTDLALLFHDVPENPITKDTGYELSDAYVVRPTFVRPAASDEVGIASHGLNNVRQAFVNNAFKLDFHAVDGHRLVQVVNAHAWVLSPQVTFNNGPAQPTGDAGAPLFVRRPQPPTPSPYSTSGFFRDPIGVYVGQKSDGVILFPKNRTTFSDLDTQWLDQMLSSRENRTQGWKIRHGKDSSNPYTHSSVTTSYWAGEVDYVGACDSVQDQDCDHWYDHGPFGAHDNCPYKFNPNQIDNDDDTIGDVCETSPCAPDVDGDGVRNGCDSSSPFCATKCLNNPPVEVDNCPGVFNPFQENANVEFERASAARLVDVGELGDACDPVPTPRPDPKSRLDSQCKPIGADTNPQTDLGQVCSGVVFEDNIETTGIAPHARWTSSPTPIAVSVTIAATKPRFCQDDPLAIKRVDCHGPLVLRDSQLTAWSDADAERGDDPSRPWHRITIGGGSFGFRDDVLPPITFGGAPVSTKWFFDRDVEYWATGPNAPKVTGPNMGNCPLADCLNGFVWMNTSTAIGSNSLNATLKGVDIGFHGTDLANGLTPIVPKNSNMTWCVPPLLPRFFPLASVQGAPSSSVMPVAPLLWPSTGTLRLADQRGVDDTQLLVPSGGDMLAALMDDGTLLAVHDLPDGGGGAVNCGGNKIDDTLNSVALGPSGGQWLNAVEANRAIGGADAIAIASDGTHLIARATASGDTFAGALVDPASGGSVTDVVAPSARTGFLSFYSRSLGGVFVAAGTANGTTSARCLAQAVGRDVGQRHAARSGPRGSARGHRRSNLLFPRSIPLDPRRAQGGPGPRHPPRSFASRRHLRSGGKLARRGRQDR